MVGTFTCLTGNKEPVITAPEGEDEVNMEEEDKQDLGDLPVEQAEILREEDADGPERDVEVESRGRFKRRRSRCSALQFRWAARSRRPSRRLYPRSTSC